MRAKRQRGFVLAEHVVGLTIRAIALTSAVATTTAYLALEHHLEAKNAEISAAEIAQTQELARIAGWR